MSDRQKYNEVPVTNTNSDRVCTHVVMVCQLAVPECTILRQTTTQSQLTDFGWQRHQCKLNKSSFVGVGML